jgi:hypothetical protein
LGPNFYKTSGETKNIRKKLNSLKVQQEDVPVFVQKRNVPKEINFQQKKSRSLVRLLLFLSCRIDECFVKAYKKTRSCIRSSFRSILLELDKSDHWPSSDTGRTLKEVSKENQKSNEMGTQMDRRRRRKKKNNSSKAGKEGIRRSFVLICAKRRMTKTKKDRVGAVPGTGRKQGQI